MKRRETKGGKCFFFLNLPFIFLPLSVEFYPRFESGGSGCFVLEPEADYEKSKGI